MNLIRRRVARAEALVQSFDNVFFLTYGAGITGSNWWFAAALAVSVIRVIYVVTVLEPRRAAEMDMLRD